MKHPKNFKPTTTIKIALGILLIALLALAVFYYNDLLRIIPGYQQKQDSELEARANLENKKKSLDTPQAVDKNNSTNSERSDYHTPSDSSAITIITEKHDQNDVTVRSELRGYSDGKCIINITNDQRKWSNDAPVIFQREFASCAGFSVPVSALGTGEWNIKLSIISGNNTNEKSISFKVE